MRDAVIVEAVRTPVGGATVRWRARIRPTCPRRAARARRAHRASIPRCVDDVIWGCVSQVGEQTFDIARTAVLSAGWPESVPGTTVDRQCGSSQQAMHFAAAGVIAGHYDLVVAGGVESMSPRADGLGARRGPVADRRAATPSATARIPNQGIGAEMIAERWGLRARGSTSSRCARTARPRPRSTTAGSTTQIVPVERWPAASRRRRGRPPRRHAREARDARSRRSSPTACITAGNSSQISDGAAALLLCGSETAARARADADRARPHRRRWPPTTRTSC